MFMAAKKGGLGRGLDALFADNSIEEIAPSSAVKLKIMDIEPNRDQPRKIFDEQALSELADSIAKHGVIQPLLVRPLPAIIINTNKLALIRRFSGSILVKNVTSVSISRIFRMSYISLKVNRILVHTLYSIL